MDAKGIRNVPVLHGHCCRVSIELLEVTIHPTAFKKPGMDASANITVTDADGKLVYSKGYHDQSRTLMNAYGHLINHACEDMVNNVMDDENFIHALVAGKL